MGKDDLAAVQGKDEKVVFQKKDASETILYSWEFYGEDISTAEDLDFAINTETQLPENVADLVKGDALYLDFAQEGALPGSATINVQVGDTFATDAMLTLYYYHEDNQELELVADQLQIENGYVAFQLDHCSAYVLTAGPLAAESALAWWVILIIAVVVVAIIVIVVWNKKKKSVA